MMKRILWVLAVATALVACNVPPPGASLAEGVPAAARSMDLADLPAGAEIGEIQVFGMT